MTISIIEELCDGCGICVDSCPNSAISLSSEKAKIDEVLCTSCELCVSLCPVEAIQIESISKPMVYIPETSRVPSGAIQTQRPLNVQIPSYPQKSNSFLSKLGVALSTIGRELLPYFAEGFAMVLEQRIASPRGKSITSSTQTSTRRDLSRAGRSSARQRRRRIRRGRNL